MSSESEMHGINTLQGDTKEDRGRRIFAGNAVALALMQAAKYVFPLVTLPYLARVLGAEVYAVRAYVVSFMVFMQTIIDFGFAQYGTKEVASHQDDIHYISSVNSNVYLSKTLLLLLSGIITLVASTRITILADNMPFVVASLLSVYFKAMLPDFILQGLQDMFPMTIRFVVTQGLSLALILLLVKGPNDLLLVPLLELFGSFVALVWSIFYLWKRHGVWFGKLTRGIVRDSFLGSLPFFVALASSAFLSSTITVAMGIFPTERIVIACWSIVSTVIQGVQAIWQPISRSLFPHMVKSHDSALIKKLLKFGIPLVLVVVVICYFNSNYIMYVLGGAEYVEGAYLLRGVIPVLLFSYPISIIGYPVIGALGEPSKLSLCVMVSGFAQLAFLAVVGFMGHFGPSAIITARVGSELLLFMLESYFAWKMLNSSNQ